MISFVVHGNPQPAGSKRGFVIKGKGAAKDRVVVTDAAKNSRPWKSDVAAAAADAMRAPILSEDGTRQIGSQNGALLEGPLAVVFVFYVPRPKGHFGKKGLRPAAPAHPAVRPDVLKLARAVEDACTGIVWRDDAQIVHETIVKGYGEPARVEVKVQALG
jgi:Holliday junction resolvase RusA-like endonuclease